MCFHRYNQVTYGITKTQETTVQQQKRLEYTDIWFRQYLLVCTDWVIPRYFHFALHRFLFSRNSSNFYISVYLYIRFPLIISITESKGHRFLFSHNSSNFNISVYLYIRFPLIISITESKGSRDMKVCNPLVVVLKLMNYAMIDNYTLR